MEDADGERPKCAAGHLDRAEERRGKPMSRITRRKRAYGRRREQEAEPERAERDRRREGARGCVQLDDGQRRNAAGNANPKCRAQEPFDADQSNDAVCREAGQEISEK